MSFFAEAIQRGDRASQPAAGDVVIGTLYYVTDEEVTDGKAYWDAAWPDAAAELLAWRALVKKIGVPRASWVVEAMTPSNLGTRPAGAPAYPPPARRESSWTRPAEARLLPDRWHVLLESAGGERIVSGSAIHEPLALTFSPDPGDPTDPLGPDGLRLSSDVLWTVDFDQAEKVGMGIRIPLSATERAGGFTRVIVFGVKSSLAPDVSASGLQELLGHHRHGRGFTLLPQGTPTNNTSAATTPFPPSDGDAPSGCAPAARPNPWCRPATSGAPATCCRGCRGWRRRAGSPRVSASGLRAK